MRFSTEQYAAVATFLLALPALGAPVSRDLDARTPSFFNLIEEGVNIAEKAIGFAEKGMGAVEKGEQAVNRVTTVANKVGDGVNAANQASSAIKSVGQGIEHLLHIPDAQQRADKKAAKQAQQAQKGHRRSEEWHQLV